MKTFKEYERWVGGEMMTEDENYITVFTSPEQKKIELSKKSFGLKTKIDIMKNNIKSNENEIKEFENFINVIKNKYPTAFQEIENMDKTPNSLSSNNVGAILNKYKITDSNATNVKIAFSKMEKVKDFNEKNIQLKKEIERLEIAIRDIDKEIINADSQIGKV